MLIALGGLPGTGKTTIARELARQLGAVHLRIDSIEQALRDMVWRAAPWTMRGIGRHTQSLLIIYAPVKR